MSNSNLLINSKNPKSFEFMSGGMVIFFWTRPQVCCRTVDKHPRSNETPSVKIHRT